MMNFQRLLARSRAVCGSPGFCVRKCRGEESKAMCGSPGFCVRKLPVEESNLFNGRSYGTYVHRTDRVPYHDRDRALIDPVPPHFVELIENITRRHKKEKCLEPNHSYYKRVNSVANDILKVWETRAGKMPVDIIIPDMALPKSENIGELVVISSGTIYELDRRVGFDAKVGLAAVVGHEIAHLVAKHTLEKFTLQQKLMDDGHALNSDEAKRQTSDFSWRAEHEADKICLMLCAGAKYDPLEVISAHDWWLQKLEDISAVFGQKPKSPEKYPTHPLLTLQKEDTLDIALKLYRG